MSLLVVAIGPRPDLDAEYEPAKCVSCDAPLMTSAEVRRVVAKQKAEVACVFCALTQAKRDGRTRVAALWDGGPW